MADPTLVHHVEAIARLSALCGEPMEKRRLARLMRETPDHIVKPWINVGHPDRARWMWEPDGIERWFREVCAWQASIAFSRAASSGSRSDGVRSTGRPVRSRSTRKTRRSASGSTSKPPVRLAEIGSLRKYLESENQKSQGSSTR